MPSNQMTSVDFYDSLWEQTRRVDQHHKCRAHAIRKMLKVVRGDHRNFNILEPGCGCGIISEVLAEWGHVTGLDQSSIGVEQARASVPGNFVVARLPEIAVDRTDFHVSVLSQVLEHFEPDDQARLLTNVHRHVIDEGHLIVTTPNRPVSGRMSFRSGELQPIENWLDPDQLVDLLHRTGWQVERVLFCFSFFPIAMSRFSWLRPARYLVYEFLKLRSLIEDWTESAGIGDTTVILARKLRQTGATPSAA